MAVSPTQKVVINYLAQRQETLNLLKKELTSSAVDRAKLNDFCLETKRKFPNGSEFFQSFMYLEESKRLKQEVVAKYLALANQQIDTLYSDDRSTAEDVYLFLDQFIKDFPQGSQEIIHFRETDEYKILKQSLIGLLHRFYNSTDDRWKEFKTPRLKGLCVEAMILQNLAKMQISMREAKPVIQGLRTIKYSDIIEELATKAAKYLTKKPKAELLSKTLAGLTELEIMAFARNESDRFRIQTFYKNSVVDPLATQGVNYLNVVLSSNRDSFDVDKLIRIIHSLILVAPSKNWHHYLKKEMAKQVLEHIANASFSLNIKETSHAHLARQLYVIRSVYPDVFPSALTDKIKPFIEVFDSETHGSAFENQVFAQLSQAIKGFSKKYPGILDVGLLSNTNPISMSLGLESDLTYVDGTNVKISIQVDGDKYHLYPGSRVITQKTLLRDHCFAFDDWCQIKVTDRTKDFSGLVFEQIILPAFEGKLRERLEYLDAKIQEEMLEFQSHIVADERDMLKQPYAALYNAFKHSLQRVQDLQAKCDTTQYQTCLSISKDYPAFVAQRLRVESELEKVGVQLKDSQVEKSNIADEINSITVELEETQKEFDANVSKSKEKCASKQRHSAAREKLGRQTKEVLVDGTKYGRKAITEKIDSLDKEMHAFNSANQKLEKSMRETRSKLSRLKSISDRIKLPTEKCQKLEQKQASLTEKIEFFDNVLRQGLPATELLDALKTCTDCFKAYQSAKLTQAQKEEKALRLAKQESIDQKNSTKLDGKAPCVRTQESTTLYDECDDFYADYYDEFVYSQGDFHSPTMNAPYYMNAPHPMPHYYPASYGTQSGNPYNQQQPCFQSPFVAQGGNNPYYQQPPYWIPGDALESTSEYFVNGDYPKQTYEITSDDKGYTDSTGCWYPLNLNTEPSIETGATTSKVFTPSFTGQQAAMVTSSSAPATNLTANENGQDICPKLQ